jgi:hypothetical protein
MDADGLVAGCMGGQGPRVLLNRRDFPEKPCGAPLDHGLVRFKPRIILDQFRFLPHAGPE